MSGGEIVIIVFVALLLFGSKAIPDIAKTMGKAMREFQKATNEIKREISDAGVGNEIKDLKSTIHGAKSDIEQGIKTHTAEIDSEVQEIKKDVKTEADNISKAVTDEEKN
jgi:sec-independent protein translocase protein TatA